MGSVNLGDMVSVEVAYGVLYNSTHGNRRILSRKTRTGFLAVKKPSVRPRSVAVGGAAYGLGGGSGLSESSSMLGVYSCGGCGGGGGCGGYMELGELFELSSSRMRRPS